MYQIQADGGFLDIFKIPLLEGRNFRDRDLRKDLRRNGPDEFILNQAAVRALGFPDDVSPVDHPVQVYGGDEKRLYKHDHFDGTIVGIVPDFHFQSLHEPVRPLIINPDYWACPAACPGQSSARDARFLRRGLVSIRTGSRVSLFIPG